jgi:phage terminase Nu1 subunit (DNA packaging protein)
MSRQILNGWKEISSHFKRSVRTVQRWEDRLGLPVYRPALKDRSAVLAFSDELDCWISRAAPDVDEEDALPNGHDESDASLLRVLDSMSAMVLDTAELSSHVKLLQEQLRESLETYHHIIASRTLAAAAQVSGRSMGPVLTFRPSQHGMPHVDTVLEARDKR